MAHDRGRAQRRFAFVQAGKAALGLAACVAYVFLVGPPSWRGGIAAAGLLAPGVLAGLSFVPIPLAALETASFASLAGLVGFLAWLTGGLDSPLVVWFVLVPAEASLAGGRGAVWRAAAATSLALLFLGIVQSLSTLPQITPGVLGWPVYLCVTVTAVAQAALLAVAAQDQKRETDRIAAEGAAMYRFLADNAMDLITRHGSDGRIRFASPACLTLLGSAPESLIGTAPQTLAHPDDLKNLQQAFVEASYFGRAATAEVRLKRTDGTYVWTEMRCRPAATNVGKAADIVAVTRDVSERKVHENALIEARDLAEEGSRAKSRFLANMSHELRTPLNAIIGFSEVMTHEMFGPLGAPRYQEYTRLIHESGGHLLELINGILDMSKIEAGKFQLAEEVFDLEDVAAQALRFVKLQAERKGVLLKTRIADDARNIFADRRAIKQVLVNLLTNSVKFTPRGGEVTVAATRVGAGVEVSVSDTGIGIAPADLARLGRPFEQVEGSHVRAHEGTGLGLALVRAFAHMHGGEAVIDSTLGLGTRVTLKLPYAAVSQDDPRRALPEARQVFKGAA